jgi:peptidoglycan/LPS O-acetylase OafA/YrhL
MLAKRIAAIYAIVVGMGMFGMWTMLVITGQVPELQTEPIRIAFHLAAEFLTAALLVVGGLGLLTNRRWGYGLFLVALGALLYTVVVSPGYYAQSGDMGFVAMFATLFILTVVFVGLALGKEADFRSGA